ncbi:Fc receptor-like protein 5 [Melanotaenia boesemani]|uniref:Fc receptor-like protein 5 n=1 Tax=Melanotaenia boesemani TaxID=1250792 RepID=UPI001C058B8C|nr:Fc receptor-like protein 5 [Melanotaenia boesemani]
MKTPLLVLFVFTSCRTSDARASIKVSPSWPQYFEYDEISISCEQFGPGKWTVWGYSTERKQLSQCGSMWGSPTASTCQMKTVKQSNSGVYWCQSAHRDSSNAVNITITDKPVILQSPVLPVMEGEDVTLSCKANPPKPFSNPTAAFYKDSTLIRTEPTGHMTLKNVSKLNEGSYTCRIDHEESPPSWLLMRDDSEPASLSVSPDLSQLFEYEKLSLSCGNSSFDGWRISRFTSEGQMSTCGQGWGTATSSVCNVHKLKQRDSAIYWCESPTKQRSNSVQISVHDKPVILQSPVLPVKEGHTVTLCCKAKTTPSNLPASFYKDGSFIRTEPTGHMTLHPVSRSDEGLYRCNISGHGESPPSWLFVRAVDVPVSQSTPTPLSPTVLRVILHIMVSSPYFISTILALSLYRHNCTGRSPPVSRTKSPRSNEEEGMDRDDATADVTTEHHF